MWKLEAAQRRQSVYRYVYLFFFFFFLIVFILSVISFSIVIINQLWTKLENFTAAHLQAQDVIKQAFTQAWKDKDTHRTPMEPTYCQRFSSLKISLLLLQILSCLVHLSKYLKHYEYLGEINLSDDPTSDANLCRPFPAFSSSSKPGKFPGWCGSHYVPELHAVRM